MPQAKKKQATKTAAKKQGQQARKTTRTKACACKQIDAREKMHVYIVTVMSMIAALLLCADVAMVIV